MVSGQWKGSHSRGFPAPIRAVILRRDPVCRCQGCERHHGPCSAPSTEADHVVNVATGGTHHPTNGQGLCSRCHRAKTQAEAQASRTHRSRTRPPEQHPGVKGGG